MLTATENTSVNHKNTQKFGALASWGMAACYIYMFIVFGALLAIPQTDNLAAKMSYIASHHNLISSAYSAGYLLFGSLLLIAIQSIHQQFNTRSSMLLNSASLFGLVWVVLMMASGMIALVAMHKMIALHEAGNIHAESLFYAWNAVVNGLGGGIELVGGLWVLLLSLSGLKHRFLAKGLHYLGIWVGIFGILTVFQSVPDFKEVFGLSQIVWFLWLGTALAIRKPD